MLEESTGSQELSAGNQLSAIAEIEWILAESGDTKKRKYRATGVASYGQANWERDHLRGSTAVSKDTTAQSQVQGLVAGPILQRYLGWISSEPVSTGV